MVCDSVTVMCALQNIEDAIRDQSPWDTFWPTVLATALGAAFAALFSFLLFRAEQRRRHREERMNALSAVIHTLAVLTDALTSRSSAALDSALNQYGAALARLRMTLNDKETIVERFIARETLWWPKLPIDELTNRSGILREELMQWARGTLDLDHFEKRFKNIGDSGMEGPETPETLPAHLRDINRDQQHP